MNATTQEQSAGFLSLTAGMHSGLDPIILADDAYHKGINVICRSGTIQTRPAFVEYLKLPSGKFQGARIWKLESCDRLVCVIDGTLYSTRLDTKETLNHGLLFSQTVDRVYFCQAYKWVVIQDGASQPKALEEDSTGKAVVYTRPYPYKDKESPPKDLCLVPGTVMTYSHGRIHFVPSKLPAIAPVVSDYANPEQLNATPTVLDMNGKASFVSTDVLDIYVPDFLFRMTEHRVLNEGGAIELPNELGYINGMSTFRNAATGTGNGALVVFGREGVCAFDVSIPRDQWKEVQIGQALFSTIGTLSPYSITQINTDIGFIDTEGKLRTLKYESSGVANTLTSLPMSFELDVFHKQDTTPYLTATSMNLHDSRLTWTMRGQSGPSFMALASLDFAKYYAMGQADKPSFDGIWTGFDFQQTLSARDANKTWRHFVIIKKGTTENVLFVMDDTAKLDNNDTKIQSTIVTKLYDFGSPINTKALQYFELWLSDVAVDSTVSVYFRPRGYPNWTLASSRSFHVPSGSPQVRRRVMFPVTVDDVGCDPVSGEKLCVATHIQFAVVWSGRLKIDRLRAAAALRVDPPVSCLDKDNPDGVGVVEDAMLSDFAYRVF